MGFAVTVKDAECCGDHAFHDEFFMGFQQHGEMTPDASDAVHDAPRVPCARRPCCQKSNERWVCKWCLKLSSMKCSIEKWRVVSSICRKKHMDQFVRSTNHPGRSRQRNCIYSIEKGPRGRESM